MNNTISTSKPIASASSDPNDPVSNVDQKGSVQRGNPSTNRDPSPDKNPSPNNPTTYRDPSPSSFAEGDEEFDDGLDR